MLRLGSIGDEVRVLQQALNLVLPLVLPKLVTDGQFGQRTHGRVMAFQGQNGLDVDGVVGDITLAAIAAAFNLLGLSFPPAVPAVRSITQEILGMTPGADNLIVQTIPSISVIDRATFRPDSPGNTFRFSTAPLTTGRLGLFAARKGDSERAVILLLPASGRPSSTLICITQTFGQAWRTLNPLHWGNPLSPEFIKFVLLKHVVNRFGAQMLASRRNDLALVYIVRANRGPELGPFVHDGPFMLQVLSEMAALTNGAFGFSSVEAFTFSSGISDFNAFIPSISPVLNVAAVYSIDPASATAAVRPSGGLRKQYLSGQTGGPRPGFEFMPMDRWVNEDSYPRRMTFDNPWPFNYMHNHCMPLYVLNLALNT